MSRQADYGIAILAEGLLESHRRGKASRTLVESGTICNRYGDRSNAMSTAIYASVNIEFGRMMRRIA